MTAKHQSTEKDIISIPIDEIPIGIAITHTNGKIININKDFCRITEYNKNDLLSKSIFDLIHPIDRIKTDKTIKNNIKNKKHKYSTTYNYITKNKKSIELKTTNKIIKEKSNFTYIIITIEETNTHNRDNTNLEKTGEIFNQYFESSPNGLVLINNNGIIEKSNISVENMFGYTRSEISGNNINILIPHIYNKISSYDKKPKNISIMKNNELYGKRKDTCTFSIAISLSQILLNNRKLILITIFDTTEFKETQDNLNRQLENKITLLNEVHHRIKNNLQVMSSLLSLQSQHYDIKVREALETTQGRLRAMALIHQLLYEDHTFSKINILTYINHLTRYLREIYVKENIKIDLESKKLDIYVNINQAVPCGLLITELITNAFKHAFKGNNGYIRVLLSIEGTTLIITVIDNGIGLPDNILNGEISSLGFQLIPLLAKQANAEWKVFSDKNGTCFTIYLPITLHNNSS